MFTNKLPRTLFHVTVIATFLIISSIATNALLNLLLPIGMQPTVFMLICLVYWLILDNITFCTDLNAAEDACKKNRHAEETALKIAVGAISAGKVKDDVIAGLINSKIPQSPQSPLNYHRSFRAAKRVNSM